MVGTRWAGQCTVESVGCSHLLVFHTVGVDFIRLKGIRKLACSVRLLSL
jgi:hypothetical protein